MSEVKGFCHKDILLCQILFLYIPLLMTNILPSCCYNCSETKDNGGRIMSYKIETLAPYKRVYQQNEEKVKSSKLKPGLDVKLQDILLLLAGFFLGRSIIMGEISPFGFAFFACILARQEKSWIALAVLPGLMSMQSTLYVIRAMITFALMFWAMGKYVTSETKTWKASLIASLCVFSVGMVFQYIKGNYLFDFFLLLFESVVTYILFFIFTTAIPLLFGRVKRQMISNEELTCGAIFISLTLLGINTFSIAGFSIKNILGITFILTFARYLGSTAGSTMGIIVGLISSLSSFVSPAIIGTYAFAGLLSGVFKDLGKLPVALGFILGNATLTFYINGSTEVFIPIEEILVATIFLLIMPSRIEERIASFQGVETYRLEREKLYGDRVREVTVDRLKDYSKVFEQMGKSFEQVAISNALLSKNDLDEVFDRVTQEVCSSCSLCFKCWEKEFYTSYQRIFHLLNKLEKDSGIDKKELEKELSKDCIHSNTMLHTLTYLYENYQLDQYWKKQVMECKNLVSQQLKGVSDVIYDLGKDMRRDIVFKKEEEEEILIAFDKRAIPIKDVMVIEDAQGKYEVTIYGDPCEGAKYCHADMKDIISETLGRNMTMEQHVCTGNGLDHKCKVFFQETIHYNITTGVVRAAKNPGEVSGDSYTSIPLQDGKHMLALSDGMGSGKRAAKESRTTIDLLENFFEAGFNREIALKTINSILMLRSSDEMFSTIDLSIIDQHTGKTEFIKIGAVSTFIKRGNKIKMIASNSLPVGILEEVNLDITKQQLEDGDFIIMLSDGLLDANPFVEDKEQWIMEQLESIHSKNPQKIAEILLERVKKESKYGLTDDTTILVTKIWKNKEK